MTNFPGFLFAVISKEEKNQKNGSVHKAPLLSRKEHGESDLKAM
jgi:hypothetical protein